MRTLIDELKQSEYLPATLSAIAGCRAGIQSSTVFMWTAKLSKKANTVSHAFRNMTT